MKSLRKLHMLIHTLSRDEKRYFKQHANVYSSDKEQEYILLFDIISKYKTFNLPILKKEIKRKKISYLSLKTKYLYNTILDALCRKKKKQNKQIQLEDELRHISILEEKGFLEDALDLLKKLQTKAETLNLHWLLYQTYSKEIEILLLRDHGKLTKLYLKAYEEKNKYFNILKNINDYKMLSLLFYQQDVHTPEFLQDLSQHPLLKNEDLALSLRAKIYFYNIWSQIHNKRKNLDELLFSRKKIIELIPKSTHISYAKKLAFFQNYFVATFYKKSYEDFLYGLDILRSIEFPYKQHQAIGINLELGFLMCFYIRNIHPYTPEDAQNILDRNEKFYNQYHHLLHWNTQKLWFFDIVSFGILLKDKEIMGLWLERLMTEVASKYLNEEEKLAIKILNIILFYEKGIQSLIEREVKSLFYFIDTKKINNPILLETTVFFDLLQKTKDKKEKLILFNKYQLILADISPQLTNSFWNLKIINQWVALQVKQLGLVSLN